MLPSLTESQREKDGKEMNGYPRGISRSIVCVTSISGTCHHIGTRPRGFRIRTKYPTLVLRVDQIREDLT